MKKLPIALLILLLAAPLQAREDHIETALTVTVSFGTGETPEFGFRQGKITSFMIKIGNMHASVPERVLNRMYSIHMDSTCLLWDGKYVKAEDAPCRYIRFEYGDEKYFGEYPKIELYFSGDRFQSARHIMMAEDEEGRILLQSVPFG